MAVFFNRMAGDPAPDFHQRSMANPAFSFNTVGGRYIVLCFFLSAGDTHSRAAIQAALDRPDLFDDNFASFFGVTVDPVDEENQRVGEKYPGYRFFLDMDFKISRLYGAVDKDATEFPKSGDTRRLWMVLDPTLRIMKVLPFNGDHSDCTEIMEYLDTLPPPSNFTGLDLQAPILILPNVFEPELCQELIHRYETEGSVETGHMQEKDGKTVGVIDPKHKRRRDHTITEQAMIDRLRERLRRRVIPEIEKVHQFKATRMERYIVGCYTAEDGGHFRAHRDNTTKGTAHRRFAVSINLNDDFDGGEVSFPEYGPRSFKAPAGGAVVFSCSLLHMVSKVTRGRRYAFLPFIYDDEAAEIRNENRKFLGGGGFGEETLPKTASATEEAEAAVPQT